MIFFYWFIWYYNTGFYIVISLHFIGCFTINLGSAWQDINPDLDINLPEIKQDSDYFPEQVELKDWLVDWLVFTR